MKNKYNCSYLIDGKCTHPGNRKCDMCVTTTNTKGGVDNGN